MLSGGAAIDYSLSDHRASEVVAGIFLLSQWFGAPGQGVIRAFEFRK